MEDLAEKLKNILSSAEGQEQLKNIASMFGGSNPPDLSGLFPKAEEPSSESAPLLDANIISALQQVMQGMNHNDKNTELLRALKPHFGEERQERVDQAIKLLRLVSLLPVLQQSGLFTGLL